MLRSSLWPAVLLGSLVACGDGGGNGGPAPSPTVVEVLVSFPAGGTIFIGRSVQLEARERLSNGSTRLAASATWGSDAPAVATVSPTGLVTGVAAGEATIYADVNPRGTLRIRVFPNFGGTWRGSEVVTGCADAGLFSGFCGDPEFPAVGEVFGHSARFTQTDASVSAVLFEQTGGGSTVTTTGSVSIGGELTLLSAPMLPADPQVTTQVQNWRSRADVPLQMTGTYDLLFTAPGIVGEVRINVRLQDVVSVSGTLGSRAGEVSVAQAVSRTVQNRLARLR